MDEKIVKDSQGLAKDLVNDCISRKAAIEALAGMIDRFERILADIRETKVDDSVCGMCEYDGAYIGQSGDWCNECPGFDKDNCFKLSDRCRKRWMGDITLPSAQPKSYREGYQAGFKDAQPGRMRGKWIRQDNKGKPLYGWYQCSECGAFCGGETNFCSECGADMREVDE